MYEKFKDSKKYLKRNTIEKIIKGTQITDIIALVIVNTVLLAIAMLLMIIAKQDHVFYYILFILLLAIFFMNFIFFKLKKKNNFLNNILNHNQLSSLDFNDINKELNDDNVLFNKFHIITKNWLIIPGFYTAIKLDNILKLESKASELNKKLLTVNIVNKANKNLVIICSKETFAGLSDYLLKIGVIKL